MSHPFFFDYPACRADTDVCDPLDADVEVVSARQSGADRWTIVSLPDGLVGEVIISNQAIPVLYNVLHCALNHWALARFTPHR